MPGLRNWPPMISTSFSGGRWDRWARGPPTRKRARIGGIYGRLYFHDDDSGQSKQIIFSVKAGGVTVSQIRDLQGVLGREKAEIGVFVTFDEPTKPMQKEAAEAGFYKSTDGTTYPKLQILTIQQILDGETAGVPAAPAGCDVQEGAEEPSGCG